MQTLGERLEEARKRKGISVREAAEATKIRGDYLQKFEANSFDFDLPPLYVRGFLRTYAKFLELDSARVLSEFETLMIDAGRAPRRETRETYGRVEVGNESGESAPARTSSNGLDPVMLKYLMFGGGAIVLLLIVLIVANLLTSGPAPKAAAKPVATESTESTAPTRPAPSETTLTLIVTESTRVRVIYADNSLVFLDGKYPMNRGESRTFNYSKELRMMVEHPDRVRIEINGQRASLPDSVKPLEYFRIPVVPRT